MKSSTKEGGADTARFICFVLNFICSLEMDDKTSTLNLSRITPDLRHVRRIFLLSSGSTNVRFYLFSIARAWKLVDKLGLNYCQ